MGSIDEEGNTFLRLIIGVLVVLLLVIFVARAIDIFEHQYDKYEVVYDDCVDACSQKHFMGYAMGRDIDSRMTTSKGNLFKVYTPTINEFDRTDCIKSCNEMYMEINDLVDRPIITILP